MTTNDTPNRVTLRTAQSAMVADMLTDEELAELNESVSNTNDVPSHVRQDMQARFRLAFEKADRVELGNLEPLSA